jgi:cysteine-rich repeat protein
VKPGVRGRVNARVLAVGLALGGCGDDVSQASTTDAADTSSSAGTGPVTTTDGVEGSTETSSDSSTGGTTVGDTTGAVAACGDGMRTGLEQCDDGNDAPGDGCEPGCRLGPGEEVWAVEVDGGDDDVAHDVIVTAEGDVVVVGARRSDSGLDTWLARYDAAGALIEETVVDQGEGDDDEALSITPLGLGYVLAGVASPPGVDDGDDALLVAIDGAFEVVWSRRIDAGLDDRANAVAATDSAIAVAGHREAEGSFEDAWFAVYDTSGTEQWSRVADGPGGRNDDGRGIAWLADGGVVVVGSQAVDSQDDLWIAVRESDGSARWDRRLDFEFGDDVAAGVTIDGDEFLVAGSISSALTNSEEVWVARFAADGTEGPVIAYNAAGFVFDGAEDAVVDGDAVFVAGITAATDEQRNALVGRWPAAGGEPAWQRSFDGGPGLSDAAHAIALLPDGSVVAAGEVTVLGQGSNAWIRRWAP